MRALLIKVGADETQAGWNCPFDPTTGEFLYAPIPENRPFFPGFERFFLELEETERAFFQGCTQPVNDARRMPAELRELPMHLDPDFEYLTYGDSGRRAARLLQLRAGDRLVFYAPLRSTDPRFTHLVYGLVGLFVVKEAIPVTSLSPGEWHMNAHSRRVNLDYSDVVVRGDPTLSGRLKRCIPVSVWRNKAHRVPLHLLEAWGGLSVSDGFIQRGSWPAEFLQPDKFLQWLATQNPSLLQCNNS